MAIESIIDAVSDWGLPGHLLYGSKTQPYQKGYKATLVDIGLIN